MEEILLEVKYQFPMCACLGDSIKMANQTLRAIKAIENTQQNKKTILPKCK
jgi:hypothetical protein